MHPVLDVVELARVRVLQTDSEAVTYGLALIENSLALLDRARSHVRALLVPLSEKDHGLVHRCLRHGGEGAQEPQLDDERRGVRVARH